MIGLNRSTYYLPPAVESAENLRLMRSIDEQYLKTPFYGRRRMTAFLRRSGEVVDVKRVGRLMRVMGLEGLHPRRRTTVADPDARAHPYLLRDRTLARPDEVWSSDITYVPMRRGFMFPKLCGSRANHGRPALSFAGLKAVSSSPRPASTCA